MNTITQSQQFSDNLGNSMIEASQVPQGNLEASAVGSGLKQSTASKSVLNASRLAKAKPKSVWASLAGSFTLEMPLLFAVICGWVFTALFFGLAGFLMLSMVNSFAVVLRYDNV